jgi:hypothetical protein
MYVYSVAWQNTISPPFFFSFGGSTSCTTLSVTQSEEENRRSPTCVVRFQVLVYAVRVAQSQLPDSVSATYVGEDPRSSGWR